MTQIKLKRVYEPYEPTDGYRALVDRLWPRGITKESLHCDLWAKEIAPSTALRQSYHQLEDCPWDVFRIKYIEELEESSAVNDFIEKIKDKKAVTLLYASKNAVENHAVVLRRFLEEKF